MDNKCLVAHPSTSPCVEIELTFSDFIGWYESNYYVITATIMGYPNNLINFIPMYITRREI